MSQGPVEANVVLTADNSQYNQSMDQSSQHTMDLAGAVDSLTTKINNLAKSAGKKLLGAGALDTAGIVAATAAYGAWEHQMADLNAQSAMLTRTMQGQQATFRGYANSVNSIRREFGESTSEAAALVQTLTKMKDNTTTVNSLATSFEKLGTAVGESPTALASGMLQLQKTMGTSQRDTEKYSNQLAVLQSRSTASAQSILDFSNAIAPVGRLVNMSQTDIMGFSAAFIKAGQDGYQASNTFQRMVTDIAYASQSGSPQLQKYANLVGMTVGHFKQLSGRDQILDIFNAINQQGPNAIATLNRMGLDGMRTVRTIAAMSSQPGGIQAEINAANNAPSDTTAKGSHAAIDDMVGNMKRLRAETAQTAEVFGSNFAPMFNKAIKIVTEGAGAFRELMASPFGKLAAYTAAVAGGFALIASSVLMASKALAAFSAFNLFANGAASQGLRMQRAENISAIAAGKVPQSLAIPRSFTQAEAAERMGLAPGSTPSWAARAAFNRGVGVTDRLRLGLPGPPNILSRGVGYGAAGTGWLANQYARMVYGPGAVGVPNLAGPPGSIMEGTGGYDNYTRRMNFFTGAKFQDSMMAAPRFFQGAYIGAMGRFGKITGQGFTTPSGAPMTYAEAYKMNDDIDKRYTQLKSSKLGFLSSDSEKMSRAAAEVNAAKAMSMVEKEAMSASRGLGMFGRQMGSAMMIMGASGAGAARAGGGFLRTMGAGAYGMIGGNPFMLSMLGLGAAYMGHKSVVANNTYDYEDTSGFSNPYFQAAGLMSPTAVAHAQAKTAAQNATKAQALNISNQDIFAAKNSGSELTNSGLKGLSKEEALTRLSGQWSALSKDPAAISSVAQDLIKQYGAGDAQSMLNTLSSGGGNGMSALIMKAQNPGNRSWYTGGFLGYKDGDKTGSALNQIYGAINDSAAIVGQQHGTYAGQRALGKSYDQLIREFTEDYDYKSQTVAVASQFNQAFGQNVLGLTDGDLDSKHAGYYSPGNHYNLRQYLRGAFSGDQNGYLADNTELRQKVLNNFNLDTGLSGDKAADAIWKILMHPPKTEEQKSAADSIRDATKDLFGAAFGGSKGILDFGAVKQALLHTDSATAQYKGVQSIVETLGGSGLSTGQQIKYLNRLNRISGEDDSLGNALNSQAISYIMQAQQFRSPYLNRVDNFGQNVDVFKGIMTSGVSGPQGLAQQEQEKQAFAQQVQDQYQYFKGLLYQQREYEVSRSRAEEDYDTQRGYAQADFARMRERAETDFDLQRSRALQDYNLQMNRGQQDFNLTRKRQEEDHQHTIMLMVQQQAAAMYSMYDRIKTERTSSANYLLFNSNQELDAMRQQKQNLNALRKAGVNDNVIQQLGLTSTDHAQQLARFVSDVADNPEMVKQFNEAVGKRLKAAKSLVTDKSSADWKEFEHQYKLARSRAQDDFQRSVQRAHQDFQTQLKRQDQDFATSLSRQAQDFGISMNRMEDQFHLSMDRAAEDLARSAETIDGSFEKILTAATNKLGGHAQKQAQAVLQSFQNLKSSVTPYAEDLMSTLANIFGFKYSPPKSVKGQGSHAGRHPASTEQQYDLTRNQATGGVLPGYSPGVDNHTFTSPTGGTLNLSGGEAIMRPEWVKAVGGEGVVNYMNRRAASGMSFARGGVYSPINAAVSRGLHDQWTGYGAVDFATPVGTPIYAVASGTVTKSYDIAGPLPSDSYHNAKYGPYGSYGRVMYLRTDMGPEVLYAHLSKRGFIAGSHVAGGTPLGASGSSGNSSGPHLHFGSSDGNPMEWITGLSGHGSIDGGVRATGRIPKLASILKDRYPRAEKAAYNMQGVHPLGPGDISGVLNYMAAKVYHQAKKGNYATGSIFNGAQTIGVGEAGPEMVLPLNDKGANYLADVMSRVSVGHAGNALRSYGATPMIHNSITSYNVDRSTNIHGPITVMANNPSEMFHQLQARQRVMAMSQPSLGGKRL